MKYLTITAPLALALAACSTQEPLSPGSTADQLAAAPHETVLLVSLEDGSIIKQTINSGADLCFKMNSDSSTTCLTQGAPVIDPTTNVIIGFKMIEDRIDLVAKSDQ